MPTTQAVNFMTKQDIGPGKRCCAAHRNVSEKNSLDTARDKKKRSQQYLMVQYLERNSMHSLIEIYYTNAFDSVLKFTQSSERALCDRCSKSAATQ